MSETKHTPGPWRVAPRSDYPEHADINVDAGTRGYVALCGKAGDEEAEANARLIAAAPELLEALREVVACYVVRINGKVDVRRAAALDRARAAIAMAEGR